MVELQHAPGDRSIFGGIGAIAGVGQRVVVLKAGVLIPLNDENPGTLLHRGLVRLAVVQFVPEGSGILILHSNAKLTRGKGERHDGMAPGVVPPGRRLERNPAENGGAGSGLAADGCLRGV